MYSEVANVKRNTDTLCELTHIKMKYCHEYGDWCVSYMIFDVLNSCFCPDTFSFPSYARFLVDVHSISDDAVRCCIIKSNVGIKKERIVLQLEQLL
jgi:hypothetical protein